MARVIALTTLGALGLSGAPVHEPVHAWQQAIPMTVTQRDTIDIRRGVLKATRLDAGAMAHLHGMALSVVAGTRRAVRRRIAARAVRISQQTPRHQQVPPEPSR